MKLFLLAFSFFLLTACTMPGGTSNPTISSETRTVVTPTQGSGKHKVEIFADFQCPACINFAKTIAPVFEGYADKGQLQISYRQFPLTMHQNAFRDAMAALCSAEKGKYVEYKKALYGLEEKKSGAVVTDEDRANLAKDIGLSSEEMMTCLASNRYKSQVESDVAYGESRQVDATPTIFLDGKKLELSIFRDMDMLVKFLDRVVKE